MPTAYFIGGSQDLTKRVLQRADKTYLVPCQPKLNPYCRGDLGLVVMQNERYELMFVTERRGEQLLIYEYIGVEQS